MKLALYSEPDNETILPAILTDAGLIDITSVVPPARTPRQLTMVRASRAAVSRSARAIARRSIRSHWSKARAGAQQLARRGTGDAEVSVEQNTPRRIPTCSEDS